MPIIQSKGWSVQEEGIAIRWHQAHNSPVVHVFGRVTDPVEFDGEHYSCPYKSPPPGPWEIENNTELDSKSSSMTKLKEAKEKYKMELMDSHIPKIPPRGWSIGPTNNASAWYVRSMEGHTRVKTHVTAVIIIMTVPAQRKRHLMVQILSSLSGWSLRKWSTQWQSSHTNAKSIALMLLTAMTTKTDSTRELIQCKKRKLMTQ